MISIGPFWTLAKIRLSIGIRNLVRHLESEPVRPELDARLNRLHDQHRGELLEHRCGSVEELSGADIGFAPLNEWAESHAPLKLPVKKTAGLHGRPIASMPMFRLLGLCRVAALVGVEPRTENSTKHSENSKVHSRLDRDVALRRICRLENDRAVTTRVGLHRRFFAQSARRRCPGPLAPLSDSPSRSRRR